MSAAAASIRGLEAAARSRDDFVLVHLDRLYG
jgi:hypothetical protein